MFVLFALYKAPFVISTLNPRSEQPVLYDERMNKPIAAKVKLSSTDHIGLLAHDIFNVSIPKHHIPLSKLVFQHGPAENDPAFGWGSAGNLDTDGDANVGAVWVSDADPNAAIGTWVSVNGGEPLGGKSGEVEFTVVGYVRSEICVFLSFFF